ncbi:hypothetical protein ACW7N6_38310 [Streptomyces sp. UC1A3]
MANTADMYRAEGYAWGLFIPGPDWLTIPGSAHRSVPLTAGPDEAERPAYAAVHGGEVSPWVLAKVQRCGGGAFRVLEVVRKHIPERKSA